MLAGLANIFALIWRISQLLSWPVYLALDLAYILWAQKGQHESWWCPKTRATKKIIKKNILISSRVSHADAWPGFGCSEPYTLSSQRTVSIQSALQSALKTPRKTTVSVRKKLKISLV